jgi:hypothetical protein
VSNIVKKGSALASLYQETTTVDALDDGSGAAPRTISVRKPKPVQDICQAYTVREAKQYAVPKARLDSRLGKRGTKLELSEKSAQALIQYYTLSRDEAEFVKVHRLSVTGPSLGIANRRAEYIQGQLRLLHRQFPPNENAVRDIRTRAMDLFN